ncbi:hypothetical protein [Paenibacillus silviterrae]|uniref:hypothetical protein n=1 Tax=Paenibacillus silviterrae TaxID=3242194 RepID=UPI002543A3C8|nr:hypothetical protein [Paenibacillus chinjuensis]
MKSMKTKVYALFVCSALLLPNVVSAATTADPKATSTAATKPVATVSIPVTEVNGVKVPGKYISVKDCKVAWVPGGVGLVVVAKDVPLPKGAIVIK